MRSCFSGGLKEELLKPRQRICFRNSLPLHPIKSHEWFECGRSVTIFQSGCLNTLSVFILTHFPELSINDCICWVHFDTMLLKDVCPFLILLDFYDFRTFVHTDSLIDYDAIASKNCFSVEYAVYKVPGWWSRCEKIKLNSTKSFCICHKKAKAREIVNVNVKRPNIYKDN